MNLIISGCSRGIGYELVKLFAKNPEHKIIALSRKQEGLEKLKDECYKEFQNKNVFPIVFDLIQFQLYSELKEKICDVFEQVDVLINNAGLLVNKAFADFDLEDFDAVYNTNVKSVFALSQLLYNCYSDGAHIVNIGSMGGVQGSAKFPGLSVYSSSKGAVSILTEVLAEELKDKNIRVNCLALGAAQTEMLSQAFPDYKAPVSAVEMADFISKFALEGHRYFNGKVLPVAVSTP